MWFGLLHTTVFVSINAQMEFVEKRLEEWGNWRKSWTGLLRLNFGVHLEKGGN